MNLYDLTADYLRLQELMEDPDIDPQILSDTMEALEGDLEVKAENYAKVIRNMEGSITALDIEQERIAAKKSVLKNNVKRMKDNLQAAMVATGKRKFKTDLFSFNIQKNGGKAPVILDVESTADLPDDLVRIKEEADLDAIRQLIEKEGSCKYAHLAERGEHLTIK